MDFKTKTGEFTEKSPEIPMLLELNYKPDHFQMHSFESIVCGHHLLVTAHTGSGKTLIAEYAIAYAIAKNCKAIYTAPIKALSNQTFKNFQERHPDWNIGIHTGDIQLNEQGQVVIMTTEILRNKLFSGELDENVKIVIFDEVHWMNDQSRGHVWDECFIKMPQGIQMVMLSATVERAEDWCRWLSETKQHPVDLIPTTHRVVPLSHNIISDNQLKEFYNTQTKKFMVTEKLSNSVCRSISIQQLNANIDIFNRLNMLPAFFFCFNRKLCDKYAHSIQADFTSSCEQAEIRYKLEKLKRDNPNVQGIPDMAKMESLLIKGVAFHHSGLLKEIREIVEHFVELGLVRVLFVTETFAAGINMPTKTVVFTDVAKFDGVEGKRFLLSAEYHQMAGRAGRRGKDTRGYVVIMPLNTEPPTWKELEYIVTGSMSPLTSKFRVDYCFILKMLKNKAPEPLSADEIVNFAHQTLMFKDIQQDCIKASEELKKCTVAPLPNPYKHEALIKEYIDTKLNGKGQVHKKLKKIQSQVPYDERNDFEKYLQQFQNYQQQLQEYDAKTVKIQQQLHTVQKDVNRCLDFLEQCGFIKKADAVAGAFFSCTYKGLVAAEINECNEIWLTEMIMNGELDNYSFTNIVGLLSQLLDDKSTEREFEYIHTSTKTLLETARNIGQKFAYRDNSHYNWELSHTDTDIIEMWADGCNLEDIYRYVAKYCQYHFYEGDFTKTILRLKNLCQSVYKITEMTHNSKLLSTMSGFTEKLVRSIVIP